MIQLNSSSASNPLWSPSETRIKKSEMYRFLTTSASKFGFSPDWPSLYGWSVTCPEEFWSEVAKFVGLIWQEQPSKVLQSESMISTGWFLGGKLNFAENLLIPIKYKQSNILVCLAEGASRREWNGKDLWNDVARMANWLRTVGVSSGDRVAGVVMNGPEAIIGMLASASVGAIWSSCSPDFGEAGILDRFKQINPKVLFFNRSYLYNGRDIDCSANIKAVQLGLPSLEQVVVIEQPEAEENSSKLTFQSILNHSALKADSSGYLSLEFTSLGFEAPLYILYSSGTTGAPKCIVHSAGGTLLQHKKELLLHSDIKDESSLFFFTTCGWMMWNWMVSAFSVGAKIVTYDGSVALDQFHCLWNIVYEEKVTVFGTSPKFISACMKADFHRKFNFESLVSILTTGAPLLPEHFDWVYKEIKADLHLASISGGTDIISCFMLGNPLLPVYSGEIQSLGLGMAVEAWDEEQHARLEVKGELVCVKPFPSMPIGFWGDQEKNRYRSAYFSFYKDRDVWRHGDWISLTAHGGVIVYGRSDTTLNPGGVRIGTAELYRQVETFEEVVDSIVIGVPKDGDVVVVLFLKLRAGTVLGNLETLIKKKIRQELTPRHVPGVIVQVNDIPYTRSGKKVELAALRACQGLKVDNTESIANPESLEEYYGFHNQLFR
jgi:acetoacetyl-CoA synthetase